jgi:hypothetical protein
MKGRIGSQSMMRKTSSSQLKLGLLSTSDLGAMGRLGSYCALIVTPVTVFNGTGGAGDVFVAKLDPTGGLVFCTFLGGTGSEYGHDIALDGDGDTLIGGYTGSAGFPTTSGVYDMPNTSGIYNSGNPVSRVMGLRSYPNPFGATTAIVFSLPEKEEISLAIYDVNGRLVRKLAGCIFGTGLHRVRWDGRDQDGYPAPSGVYFCRIEGATQCASAKLMSLR